MLYLFKNNLKAYRKGQFVEANESAGEFIYDDIEDGVNTATLHGIAEANNIKLPSKGKKADLVEALAVGLSTLDIPEVNEMTDSQKVREIVEAGHKADKSDDAMLVEIVNAGVSFKSAAKLFKSTMEELGYRVTSKDRAESCRKVLADADFKPETYDDVNKMAEKIANDVADTSEKQAVAAIRKYCKEMEITIPKAPKKAKSATGGYKAKAYAWMVENPLETTDAFCDYMIKTLEKKESIAKRMVPAFEAVREAVTKATAS